ncbi:MAG: hypothetical protein U0Q04_09405 [Microbacterium sp.]
MAPPVSNDLSGGATERTLTAGAVSATVNYWSTLRMDRWTATAVKPISLSMVTTITPNDGQKVYLQRATMTAVPGNASQSFDPLDPQIDPVDRCARIPRAVAVQLLEHVQRLGAV